MRFILLAPFASLNAENDAAIIRLLGEHQVDTIFSMASKDHPFNKGMVPSDADVRKQIMLDAISGATIVLHPELKGDDLNDMLHAARFMHVPVVRHEDLMPLLFNTSCITDEHIDSINVLGLALPRQHAGNTRPTHNPDYTLQGGGSTLGRKAAQHYSDPGDEQPETTAVHTFGARILGDRGRALQARLLRWEQRVAHYFRGLKNPLSTAQYPAQPTPKPYRLHTEAPWTTG
jgi:hypothetical protein